MPKQKWLDLPSLHRFLPVPLALSDDEVGPSINWQLWPKPCSLIRDPRRGFAIDYDPFEIFFLRKDSYQSPSLDNGVISSAHLATLNSVKPQQPMVWFGLASSSSSSMFLPISTTWLALFFAGKMDVAGGQVVTKLNSPLGVDLAAQSLLTISLFLSKDRERKTRSSVLWSSANEVGWRRWFDLSWPLAVAEVRHDNFLSVISPDWT